MKMRNKRAISLIVLVITIIIMAILAATVIITLSNTNIISEANNAVQKTEAQQIEEAKTLLYAAGMAKANLGGTEEIADVVIDDNTIVSWNESSKKVVVKKYGVLIPDGFHYVEGTKDTGLVIEDNESNQFVWVPVEGYTMSGEVDSNGLYTSFKNVFKTGGAEETSAGSGIYKMTADFYDFAEPSEAGYPTEAEEYHAMMLSVQKYNGFYIARFEAGDGDTLSERINVTTAHKVVSKKGAYVYNYVPWGKAMNDISACTINGVENVAGAVQLSKDMYKNSTSVVSTLCYGVQWDAIMNFVSDKNHNIVESTTWGNYESQIQTCGYSETWKAKNIYDLAGNAAEITMEDSVTSFRTIRDNFMDESGLRSQVSSRDIIEFGADGSYTSGSYAFRPALYIK